MKKAASTLVFLVFFMASLAAQVPISGGWSQFAPSADSRLIYVSDLTGDDATAQFYLPAAPVVGADPFLPTGPILAFRTLAAAKNHLRSGFPDWLLFKKGETWTNQNFGAVALAGRSASEPLLIGAFGSCAERPRILTGLSNFIDFVGASASHVAIAGIYSTPQSYVGATECTAVRLIVAPFSSFLIEDCFFEKFTTLLAVHSLPSYGQTRQNLTVRRSILADAFQIGGGGGLFVANVAGVVFEENLIDHNGWNASIPGAEPNAFSHNTYFQVSNTGLVFRKNIVSRAGATGGGFRSGGLIEDNLFVDNPKGIQFGTHETLNGMGGGINWPTDFRTGAVRDNVILGCRPEPFEPGKGLQIQRIKNATVERNVIANFTTTSDYNIGALLNEAENVLFRQNIVCDWGNNASGGVSYASAFYAGAGLIGSNQIEQNDFQINNLRGACVSQDAPFAQTAYSNNRYFNALAGQNWYSQWFQPQGNYAAWLAASGETGSSNTAIAYPDASRDLADYLASIGQSGGLEAFISSRKMQSRCGWDAAFSASAVNDFIRDGYGLAAALPVEWLEPFSAKRLDAGHVRLDWATASEVQTDLFEIEKSSDGEQFETLFSKKAAGFSSDSKSYSARVECPESAFFRLKSRDLDGSSSFSNLVFVAGQSPPFFKIWPTLADDFIEIELPDAAREARFRIFSTIGKMVASGLLNGTRQSLAPASRLEIGGLEAGFYFLEIEADGLRGAFRFLKR